MKLIFTLLFLTFANAQAEEVYKCVSFDGNWSRAFIEHQEDGEATLTMKFWGQELESYSGSMIFLKYRDRDEADDSAYEEVYYDFLSEQLPVKMKIKYTQTSDGPDLLYINSPTINSNLKCTKTKQSLIEKSH